MISEVIVPLGVHLNMHGISLQRKVHVGPPGKSFPGPKFLPKNSLSVTFSDI